MKFILDSNKLLSQTGVLVRVKTYEYLET